MEMSATIIGMGPSNTKRPSSGSVKSNVRGNGHERDGGREEEQQLVGLPGERLLLHEVLEAVRHGLQQAGRSHPIGPPTVLNPACHPPLQPGHERDA
jgi:hypothetical protein